ncbi:monooxygenase flavin-binding family protein-like protein [Aureobasidium pullulans]|uniref:Monooxygenase flavin-binding family protein-like protein n=1 Tax=Aureobasidium pullulans TaxID=5580 RepID=A0A4S8T1L3_AURPU|nr:monooxygenase flavin-binding family protein-like protein [Aureobasidium pullulans]
MVQDDTPPTILESTLGNQCERLYSLSSSFGCHLSDPEILGTIQVSTVNKVLNATATPRSDPHDRDIEMDTKSDTSNYYDCLIIGAGISGINVAYRLQEQTSNKSYAILEARDSLGGTWDLFRYPGIRSDSDMYTFGFEFYPWKEYRTMADGASIKEYLKDAANNFGIDKHIRYRHKLQSANWSTDQQNWSLKVDTPQGEQNLRARFIVFCTGYYDFNEAMPATIPGIKDFQGKVVHPQFWPEDLDYENKDVVIRSPTYIAAVPQRDNLSYWPAKFLPVSWTYKLRRIQFLILPFLFFKFCKAFPDRARRLLKKGAASQLPEGYPLEPNFEPNYGPWDQRLCASPDGDFYKAIKDGQAEVITASIKQVTEKSIHLEGSDRVLTPDIIVTATGLKLIMAGGAKLSVDNEPLEVPQKHLWKGAMIEDVPNAAIVIGYTNASWTLGSDATAQFVTRLINHMDKNGMTQAVPRVDKNSDMQDQSVLNLSSTYIVKAEGSLPRAGNKAPWLPRSHYLRDLWEMKFGSITHDMQFSRIST